MIHRYTHTEREREREELPSGPFLHALEGIKQRYKATKTNNLVVIEKNLGNTDMLEGGIG